MSEKITQIRKRDDRIVKFDQEKITKVIKKALEAAGEVEKINKTANKLSDEAVRLTEKKFHERSIPAVEEIQDIVEEVLIKNKLAKTARAFIIYREQHARLRDLESLINSDEIMQGYLERADWRVKENANMDYSLQGLNNHVASTVSSHYWLNKIYPESIRRAHIDGDFHIHDLQLLACYCCGWDIKDLLTNGFGGVTGKIWSKPPKHLRTALGQVVNFFYTMQGEVAGAQALANVDTYLAPFIRYDQLDYKGVKQAIQEFLFNMNVPTRVGFQTPFTNVTFDLTPSKAVGEEAVIIGGKPQQEKYKDFQEEMNIFNRAYTEVMLEGDALGRVFSWPIPTYNISKNFDWDSPTMQPIWEMTAKYGIPYFANFVNSDMDPDDARSMCPIAGDEKVLVRSSRGRGVEYSSIRYIYEGNSKQNEYEIYSDGKFVQGRFNKFANQKMLKVVLENGHELKMTDKHLNFVLENEKSKTKVLKGKELASDMYLPYSLKPHMGEGGNHDLGFFVGAYAGDGSFDGETSVVFSLEKQYKKGTIDKLQKIAGEYFGAHSVVKEHKKTKLVTLKIHSRAAVGMCKDFVEGKERVKHYRARLFTTSLDFRKGVIEGHMATDGGNRNRIYTSSPKMVETLNMLAATMGTTTSIYRDARPGRLGTEPNYAVLIYQLNRQRYGKVWFKKNDKLWVKIKSIKSISNNTAYCFEVKNGEPMFTVGSTGILTHNCRLRLDNRELRKRGGGLFGANPLTGSAGVVTINMPRLGYLSKDKEDFKKRLFSLMELARESLELKRKILEKFTESGLYPYCRFYLRDIFERFGEYWKNHFNTIGLNGLNEACINLLDKDITTPEGHQFAEEMLTFMREKLMDYQLEFNHLFNLEATPAEGTSFRFAKIDKKKYADIVVANEDAYQKDEAAPYYTNSSHLPVGYTDDIFEALEKQDSLQTKYTGGTVLHGFVGEKLSSGESVKKLVRKIAENYHLPYFTITPTFSICPKHGYIAGEHEYCPTCDEEIGYVERGEDKLAV